MATTTKYGRSRSQATSKKRVRLKTNQMSPITPDIFSDHWLVDSPRKIMLEKTQVAMETPLSTHLDHFYNDVAHIFKKHKNAAITKTKDLMDYLFPRIYKFAYGIGLKILRYECAGSSFDETQVISPNDVDLLLVFERHGCKIDSLEGAYRIMPLKRHKQKEGDRPDPWRFGRSEDGTYLSSMMVAKNLYDITDRALRMHTTAELEPFHIEEGKSQIVISLKNRYRISIIPATHIEKEEYYLVARPYSYDDNPCSDMLWRMQFLEKERNILHAINIADRGVRLQAFRVLKALVRTEPTLRGLTSYHLKTILLHSFDSEVDHTPRWQRDSQRECFLVLLKELQHALCTRSIPHFFVRTQNLLSNMPERLLSNLRGRVSYMLTHQNDIIRLLKKRPAKEEGVSKKETPVMGDNILSLD